MFGGYSFGNWFGAAKNKLILGGFGYFFGSYLIKLLFVVISGDGSDFFFSVDSGDFDGFGV